MVNIGYAQLKEPTEASTITIENLHVFPNPVENGKIYITTKDNLQKTIEIYNVLGKRVIAASTQSRILDISKLSPGIYILKIKENQLSATRKLVVK